MWQPYRNHTGDLLAALYCVGMSVPEIGATRPEFTTDSGGHTVFDTVGGYGGYRVEALAVGDAGNDISVDFWPATGEGATDDQFKVIVKKAGKVAESYDVTTRKGANNAMQVVNAKSTLIRLEYEAFGVVDMIAEGRSTDAGEVATIGSAASASPQGAAQGLFERVGASTDLLGSVDRSWKAALTGDRDDAFLYVKSVETIVDVLACGIHEKYPVGAADVVVPSALAPMVDQQRPSMAVVTKAAERLARLFDAPELVADTTRFCQEMEAPAAAAWAEVYAGPDVLANLSDVLTELYEPNLRAVQRVFTRAGNASQLAELLGTSRQSVSDWLSGSSAPGGVNAQRVADTAALARLVHRYLDPADIERYVYDTPVPALEGRTVARAVADGDARNVHDALSRALVW